VPALDRGEIWEVIGGFALGCAVLYGLDRAVPHVHAGFSEPGHTLDPRRRQALLLVSALTIHNVPEGMAVGVAFAAGGPDLGIPIALAIGIQNVPEGFAAAAPLAADNRALAVLVARPRGSSSRRPRSPLSQPSSTPRRCCRSALSFAPGRCG
jgi:zinc transporter ZupT